MKQMTIFDIIEESEPDWRSMSLKQIASYISDKTGLNFIPDTRYHGEFNNYIAYKTSYLFFTIGLSNYRTGDDRDGKPFISATYEDKRVNGGLGMPCDTLEEVISLFKRKML